MTAIFPSTGPRQHTGDFDHVQQNFYLLTPACCYQRHSLSLSLISIPSQPAAVLAAPIIPRICKRKRKKGKTRGAAGFQQYRFPSPHMLLAFCVEDYYTPCISNWWIFIPFGNKRYARYLPSSFSWFSNATGFGEREKAGLRISVFFFFFLVGLVLRLPIIAHRTQLPTFYGPYRTTPLTTTPKFSVFRWLCFPPNLSCLDDNRDSRLSRQQTNTQVEEEYYFIGQGNLYFIFWWGRNLCFWGLKAKEALDYQTGQPDLLTAGSCVSLLVFSFSAKDAL